MAGDYLHYGDLAVFGSKRADGGASTMIELYDRSYYTVQEREARDAAARAPTSALRQAYRQSAERYAALAQTAFVATATHRDW
jgi:hypothetical protein